MDRISFVKEVIKYYNLNPNSKEDRKRISNIIFLLQEKTNKRLYDFNLSDTEIYSKDLEYDIDIIKKDWIKG